MPAPNGMTLNANVAVTAREIDFVTRFAADWQALRDILGISRPIEKEPGTNLRVKRAAVVLANAPSEGEATDYSQATVVEKIIGQINLERYKKGVTLEAIVDKGYDNAVAATDEAFRSELLGQILDRFYAFANTGELTNVQSTYQLALAMAKGYVVDKWKTMRKRATEIVGFANALDVYNYLGTADISIQNRFGFEYVENFLGYRVLFLCGSSEIARGKVIATPIDNIVDYFVNPANAQFQRAGFNYRTDGKTNLIGFYVDPNYDHGATDAFALLGLSLLAEYIDGIAVVDYIPAASQALGSLTVSSVAGTAAAGDTILSVSEDLAAGGRLYAKAASSTAPAAPAFGAALDSTWTLIPASGLFKTTNGYKVQVVEVNGTGQAIAAGSATVVAKT